MNHMYLSAVMTSLPLAFEAAVRQVAHLGFSHVDVVAMTDRPALHLEALADSGLIVSCAALGKGLPEGQTLDAISREVRQATLSAMKLQMIDAARLGATYAYLVSGEEASPEALTCFGEACSLLADFAAQRMIRLCVEPIPGRALSSAFATLEWLEKLSHPELSLLLDLGHCLISGEDAARVATQAGPRLGYVHLDDNDGQTDLHWPLLAGKLTEESLAAFLAALDTVGYKRALAFEFRPESHDCLEALRAGKVLLERLGRRNYPD